MLLGSVLTWQLLARWCGLTGVIRVPRSDSRTFRSAEPRWQVARQEIEALSGKVAAFDTTGATQ
jgi:hypothetical protein